MAGLLAIAFPVVNVTVRGYILVGQTSTWPANVYPMVTNATVSAHVVVLCAWRLTLHIKSCVLIEAQTSRSTTPPTPQLQTLSSRLFPLTLPAPGCSPGDAHPRRPVRPPQVEARHRAVCVSGGVHHGRHAAAAVLPMHASRVRHRRGGAARGRGRGSGWCSAGIEIRAAYYLKRSCKWIIIWRGTGFHDRCEALACSSAPSTAILLSLRGFHVRTTSRTFFPTKTMALPPPDPVLPSPCHRRPARCSAARGSAVRASPRRRPPYRSTPAAS